MIIQSPFLSLFVPHPRTTYLPIVTMSMYAIFILRIHCTAIVNLNPTHLLVKFAQFCVDGFMMLARHCILGRPSCGIEKIISIM